jgi:23S rRNA pseudouridine1911/1915/1917 synthase
MDNGSVTFRQKQAKRVDVFISELYPQFSRSYLAKKIIEGKIKVNNTNTKVSYKLHFNDIVCFKDIEFNNQPTNIDLPIVFENDFCIVINKPSGLITHSKGSNNNDEASIASFISNRIATNMSGNRAGIVHRLDRVTSGLIIAAKTTFALDYLQKQFANRKVTKSYLAIVNGHLERQQAIINMPIERNPKHPSTFRVGPNGKTAQTSYQVITSNKDYSLLMLTPTTGRTHQLRVHLKSIKYPIIGDKFYGGMEYQRLLLHAYKLTINLPDIGKITFTAPIPQEFKKLIKIPSTIL